MKTHAAKTTPYKKTIHNFKFFWKIILKSPITKNIPTPIPITIFKIHGLRKLDKRSPRTVKSGSAIVIITPKIKDIIIIKDRDFLFVILAPIYFPTLLMATSLPSENKAIPKTKAIKEIKNVKSVSSDKVPLGIKFEYCKEKIITTIIAIGNTLRKASNNFFDTSFAIPHYNKNPAETMPPAYPAPSPHGKSP